MSRYTYRNNEIQRIRKIVNQTDEDKQILDSFIKTNMWVDSLIVFLKDLLNNKLQINANFFTEDVYDIWENAFTHVTYDRVDNYENGEFMGDRLLKFIFPFSISIKLRDDNSSFIPTEAMYTRAESYYMQNIKLSELTEILGFFKFLRISFDITDSKSIKGDLFESFFGAIVLICIKKSKENIINNLASSLLTNIFSYCKISINMEEFKIENPITAVTQLFQILSRENEKPIIREDSQTKTKTGILEIPKQFLEIALAERKVYLDSKFVYKSTQTLSNEAFKKELYQKLYEYLSSKGIDKKFAEQYKFKKLVRDLEIIYNKKNENKKQDLYSEIISKNKKMGYVEINFWTDKKINDEFTDREQLVGILPSGEQVVLKSFSSNKVGNNKFENQIKAILEYLSS